MKLLSRLAIVIIALGFLRGQVSNPTFTLISTIDCHSSGCQAALIDGDTPYYGSWGSKGDFVYNGVTIPGGVIGTFNDGSIAGCGSSNSIAIVRLNGIDFNTPSNGSTSLVNCMSSFGPGANHNWPPAEVGTCSATHVNGCAWASVGNIRVNGKMFLYVYRQDNGTNAALDATLMMSADDGATWVNPAHIGRTPQANGDAPTGPGSADYPANMMFPAIGPTDGSGNYRARMNFVRYCKDESINCPTVDNNASYVYAINTRGDYAGHSLMRVLKSNIANLNAANWEYYRCPDYTNPSLVCDVTSSGSWTSNPALQTIISNPPFMYGADPNVVWDDVQGLYIGTGFNGRNGAYYINTATHLGGPWAVRATFTPKSDCTSSGCSVFNNLILPTLTAVNSTNVRFAMVSSSSSCCGGTAHASSGTLFFNLINLETPGTRYRKPPPHSSGRR